MTANVPVYLMHVFNIENTTTVETAYCDGDPDSGAGFNTALHSSRYRMQKSVLKIQGLIHAMWVAFA